MLEKIGLPPKPSLRGSSWVVDASHCQGCSSHFTFINRMVVQLTKFDYRLLNQLDVDLQKLRCRVNYHALRFTNPILEMGKKLVERMRMKSKY